MGAVMDTLSPALTVAWALVAVWCLVQFGWYRRVRVEAAAPPPRHTQSSRRVAVAKRTVSALPTGGSPEFLAELGLSEPALPAPVADEPSIYR